MKHKSTDSGIRTDSSFQGSAQVTPSVPPKVGTERGEATKRACARHLKDLRRAHKEPPADIVVSTGCLPKFVAPIEERSHCPSRTALCAKLVK
jgi:hypothetical protein